MLTRAAPLTSIASDLGVVHGFVARFSKHLSKSDFTPGRKLPNLEIEGGYDWFS